MSGKKKQSEQQKELRDLNLPLNFDVDLLDLVIKAAPKSPNATIKSPRDAASGQAKS